MTRKNYSIILALLVVYLPFCARAQRNDEHEIRNILQRQQQAWNRGNLKQFMDGYWPSDSLVFIGKNGVVYGYQSTLANYKRSYKDTAAMGNLTMNIIKLERLSKQHYFVVGKWYLKRSVGDIGGHFSLLVEKIKGRWLIVADHSS